MALAFKGKNKKKDSPDTLENKDFQDIDESQGKKGRILKKVIFILIFISFIGFIVGILGFNLFNIRDTYLRGILENIPIVNNVLPPLESAEGDILPQMSNSELVSRIEYLEEQLNIYEDEINRLNELNSLQSAEIVRLQEIEENQLQFRADREAFDRMIAENDPNAYMTFFSSMDPENAEILYSEAVVASQQSRELRNYISTFETMDRRSASTTLETMMQTELELVVLILNNMNVEQRASILGSMSSENSAILATMLAPETLN